ncbi:hypothetical protein LCGC14_2463220, partial [marine sediment metagenome]
VVVTKLILVLGIFVPLLGMADLKDYGHPLILKPYIIRDGSIVTADKSHWIKLPWKDFVTIGQDRLLFKVDGVIYTCPMDDYTCLQEDENATEN